MPTYDEVVGSEDEGQLDDSEDEEALEKQEQFERKFNFRYEEPGGNLVRIVICGSHCSEFYLFAATD